MVTRGMKAVFLNFRNVFFILKSKPGRDEPKKTEFSLVIRFVIKYIVVTQNECVPVF